MERRQSLRRRIPVLGLLLVTVVATPVFASGARQGVHPKPGEMVLLREVSARPAYRPAPPGIALIADPTPTREVSHALGTGMDEMTDEEYAGMGSSLADMHRPQTVVEQVTSHTVNGTLGRTTGSNGLLSGGQLSRTIGGPMGAVGNTTRGIGDQVRGALAQFPLGQGAAGGPGN